MSLYSKITGDLKSTFESPTKRILVMCLILVLIFVFAKTLSVVNIN